MATFCENLIVHTNNQYYCDKDNSDRAAVVLISSDAKI